MSKSDVVFQVQYRTPKNKKRAISKWMNYATQKQKADSLSIDEFNLLKDYSLYSDDETFLIENSETFLWDDKGDLLKKDAVKYLKNVDGSGVFWRGFLSFPQDFALTHGLITKTDFYSLTNNVMPSFIVDMGLNINNVKWMCTLHRDTKNPHIHFCIYEKVPTKSIVKIPKYCIYNFKSRVANYLVDNKKFYELRDNSFKNITGKVDIKQFNKIKKQRLFSDKFRKDLNRKLLDLYNKLPEKGRLQYNSKNILSYKKELNDIIIFILMHDSIKYEYASYIKLLDQHQKELNQLYGMSDSNKANKYYDEQLNRLYSKIGNEILVNYKRYQSFDFMEKEKKFLQKHINELNFKSRNDYLKEETKKEIAKSLYKICMLSNLNDVQTKKIFQRWIKNSHYDFDVDNLMMSVTTLDVEMSTSELYNALKKLGYDSVRYNKIKSDNFYKELNYKKFINKAMTHLINELEQEEKQIVEEIQYDLEGDYDK